MLGPTFATAPMFTSPPAYGLANVRGGINAAEKVTIFWAFENIFDQQYRNPSCISIGALPQAQVAAIQVLGV